jgi:hypothetical protein
MALGNAEELHSAERPSAGVPAADQVTGTPTGAGQIARTP